MVYFAATGRHFEILFQANTIDTTGKVVTVVAVEKISVCFARSNANTNESKSKTVNVCIWAGIVDTFK